MYLLTENIRWQSDYITRCGVLYFKHNFTCNYFCS